MTTLYIRDVPEEVATKLKERARAEKLSLSAYVAGQLAFIAERPTNADVVARLRSRDRRDGPGTDVILAEVRDGRR